MVGKTLKITILWNSVPPFFTFQAGITEWWNYK
jgi:hypothetical protein